VNILAPDLPDFTDLYPAGILFSIRSIRSIRC